jgi:two-component system response regulator DctR
VPFSVLIVEDDPMVSDILRRVIERVNGFKVAGISTTENEALDSIARLSPDLILLDIYLPAGSGLNILKHVRQRELPTDIILVTAAKDVQTVYATLRFGAIDYIIKPFDLDRLRTALKNYARMRKIFNKKEEVRQDDLDKLGSKNDPDAAEPLGDAVLPKGVHQLTLEQLLTILLREKKPLTCQEVATVMSMSKITVWRYLEYLVETGKIKYSLLYGGTGRPSKAYYIDD